MKTKSTLGTLLLLSLTLLLITALVGAALAGVNQITKDRIAQLKEEKTQQAIEKVLAGGGEPIAFADESGIVSAVYQGANGYAVQVSPAGFGGAIDMMVGVGTDGTVLGIEIISHAETPSLGAVAAATSSAGENFRGQFAGLSGQLVIKEDVQAISGATITSSAVTDGVNAALACVAALG